jgi:hypothetical protein
MQWSDDDQNFSQPQPYAINSTSGGPGLPYVRFYLESKGEGQWTAPVRAVRQDP